MLCGMKGAAKVWGEKERGEGRGGGMAGMLNSYYFIECSRFSLSVQILVTIFMLRSVYL